MQVGINIFTFVYLVGNKVISNCMSRHILEETNCITDYQLKLCSFVFPFSTVVARLLWSILEVKPLRL